MYIKVSDKGINLSEDLTVPAALQLLLSAALTVMNSASDAAKEDLSPKDFEEFKGSIYDMFNAGASKVLDLFAPEYELHPDLTAEAILKAENEILNSIPTSKSEHKKFKNAIEHIEVPKAEPTE